MKTGNHVKGVLLWIEDRFEGEDLPDGDAWRALFGASTDHLFRMMDLHLEVASSYEEAMHAISKYDEPGESGAYLFCIVDLIIPREKGSDPAIKFGVETAREIKNRNIHFAFLSANANATRILDKEGLGAALYYPKEQGENPWRLPNALTMTVLSEFRAHVSWVTLDHITELLEPGSDILARFEPLEGAGEEKIDFAKYFPFFGSFREYIERCEYRGRLDYRRSFSVRSNRLHCDPFIQQAMLILLYPHILRNPNKMRVRYAPAESSDEMKRLQQDVALPSHQIIDIIRVNPKKTEIDAFKNLLRHTGASSGMTIYIIPNDESSEPYNELLREVQIMALEELPQSRQGDARDRLELIRRSSALAFDLCKLSPIEKKIPLPEGFIAPTELLINPINWTMLLEVGQVAENLSDPYEIIKEFIDAILEMEPDHRETIREAIRTFSPVPPGRMLKVGDRTFKQSEIGDKFPALIERTLDNWLNKSWCFPYALKPILLSDKRGREAGGRDEIDWEAWEDACYDVLVEILEEYMKHPGEKAPATPARMDLSRVYRFVKALGGPAFLSRNVKAISWDALEKLRWPHMRYPMPSAVTRRLKKAGRYLWIQPEGLDLAMALPTGRMRYRMLLDIVDQYWTTLEFGKKVVEHLPLGWRESIGCLLEIISDHRVGEAWSQEPGEVWDALLCLLRNGGPIMFITDQVLRGRPLSGGKEKQRAAEYLGRINGYGMILNRLRGSRKYRLAQHLALEAEDIHPDTARALSEAAQLLDLFEETEGKTGRDRMNDLAACMRDMLKAIAGSGLPRSSENAETDSWERSALLSDFYGNEGLWETKSKKWFVKDILEPIPGSLQERWTPSLLGTRVDYLWKALDLAMCMERTTRRHRYYDSYQFLTAIYDLRNRGKDTRPDAPLHVIETILDLFVAGLEGLLAQLSFCTSLAGEQELARKIDPEGVRVIPPEGLKYPAVNELAKVLRVKRGEDHWEMFTLGIPGEGVKDKPCYHRQGRIVEFT